MSATPHLNEHSCLDLLEGLIPPLEREALLDHVEGCPSCERLLARWASQREHARASVTVSTANVDDIDLDDLVLDQGHAHHEAPRRSGSGWRRRFLAPVAVAAGIVLIVALPLRQLIDSQDSSRPPELPQLRMDLRLRANESAPAELRNGIAAYAREELTEAIRLLESAPFSPEWEAPRRVYLGSAHARIGQHEQAVEVLRELDFDGLPDGWREGAVWTFVLALRSSDRTDEAQVLLRELATEPGPLGDRARDTLGNQ